MQKLQLRAEMKRLRRECADREERDKLIFSRLFSQTFMQAESFFVYHSFGTEADTRRIIKELLKQNKKVYLPRVAGKEMLLVRYEGQALLPGAFGIEEPESGEEGAFVEVCIAPLLAADRAGGRLGYGGGFYDRWLADKSCFKVGLAYSFQLVEKVPAESTDVLLDAVITDKDAIYRR